MKVVDGRDVFRVLNYLKSAGIYKNDLYGHMPAEDTDHVWYTSIPDYYFVPWSPNASANGRTILMMLKLASLLPPFSG